MKTLSTTLLLVLLLLACQTPPAPDTAAEQPPADNQPQPTDPTTAAEPADSQPNSAAGPTVNSLLSAMAQTMLRLNSLQWNAHITGEFTSTTVQQVANETSTTCSLILPNDSYCVTQELVDAASTLSTDPIELLQIGTDQWGRQGENSWQPLSGTDRPRSILLHELFQVQNGQLVFFAGEFITTADIVGQETLNGVETTIVSAEFDPEAYDLYAMWYGEDVTIPDAQQRFSTKLWIGEDGRLYQSESRLETAVQGETTLLTLETTYSQFNEPLEIPRP
ncbi:MAG: hypothetical protein KDE51_08235 [Anaerolineales bacterium]|nr:hypothetical protein [Anaerolineales bacterium]